MVIAAATRPLAHCQQDGASTARRADIARHWLAQPPSRRRTNERDWLVNLFLAMTVASWRAKRTNLGLHRSYPRAGAVEGLMLLRVEIIGVKRLDVWQ